MKYQHGLKFDYPAQFDAHMISPKQVYHDILDRNFTYYHNTFWDRIWQNIGQILFMLIAVPICTLRHGIRIYGKREFRRNKEVYRHGYISVCNHVYD